MSLQAMKITVNLGKYIKPEICLIYQTLVDQARIKHAFTDVPGSVNGRHDDSIIS